MARQRETARPASISPTLALAFKGALVDTLRAIADDCRSDAGVTARHWFAEFSALFLLIRPHNIDLRQAPVRGENAAGR
jgi:hypothetical protein